MAGYEFINLSGLVLADVSATLAEVQAEYVQIFGDDIDLDPETPEGVLIASETAARNGVAVNNAELANQINPNVAGGIYLDAIWSLTAAITGGRIFATHSVFSVAVDLTGVPTTVIPQGSIAVTAAGDEFETLTEETLDGGGLATVFFQSVETGLIPAAISALDTLGTGAPLGWETVNNTVTATLGADDESDESSRLRRIETLALQGISVSAAITSAVNNIVGVLSLSYRENVKATSENIDGVLLVPHSIYVCVDGGADADIGAALLENKTVGADWNGAVTENVTDPTSGQIYAVKFDRPSEIPTWIRVTIAPTNISNPQAVVRDAVLLYASGGLDGEAGFVVGADVSAFEIAGAVNQVEPGIFVKLVELSLDGIIYSSAEIAVDVDEVARTTGGQIETVIS